jgi:hypothetical protein
VGPLPEVFGGENAVAAVACAEITAIYRHQFSAEQVQVSTQRDELLAHRGKWRAVAGAEIGDSLEVRPKIARQPPNLTLRLASISSRRLDRTRFR